MVKGCKTNDSDEVIKVLNSENINARISEKINPRIRISNLGKDELTTDIINRNELKPNGSRSHMCKF